MEMKRERKLVEWRLKFKIDLIVWKFTKTAANGLYTKKFKIDLIVWKSLQHITNNNPNRKFKIDLIVWKCFSFISFELHI